MVSTVPLWQGWASPDIAAEHVGPGGLRRTSPDPDDLTSGFAVWAGTSFATPVIAGMIARHLTCLADAMDVADRRDRAARARDLTDADLTALGWRS